MSRSNIFFFCILFSSLISLNANELYIRVMSVSNDKIVPKVTDKLDTLGYGVYVARQKKWHVIHVGPFKSEEKAASALKVIRKRYARDADVVTLSLPAKKSIAGEPAVPKPQVQTEKKATPVIKEEAIPGKPAEKKSIRQEPVVAVPEESEPIEVDPVIQKETHPQMPSVVSRPESAVTASETTGLFIGVSAGHSTLDISQRDITGNLVPAVTPESSAVVYGVEGGYNFNRYCFATINYQKSDFSAIEYDHTYIAVNFRLQYPFAAPFIGALTGYAKQTWNQNPVTGSPDVRSTKVIMYGAQAGAEFSVIGHLRVYTAYQYIQLNQSAFINSDTESAELEYNYQHNIHVGMRYAF